MQKRWLRPFQNPDRLLHSRVSSNVPYSYWNRDNRQANVNRNDASNTDSNYAVRLGMRVKENGASRRAFCLFRRLVLVV